MTVDFTGTDAQIRGFKNSSRRQHLVGRLHGRSPPSFDPDLPRNEGSFRSVEIIAPEGSVVNPRPPAPVTMCTVFVAHEIIHAVWKALSEACPERGCAGWGKSVHGVTAGDGGEGTPFVMYHWNSIGGAGAVEGRDGFNQIGHLVALGGLTLPNVETYEQIYPVHFLRQEFRCDGGGAGAFRGGTGIDYEVEVEVPADYSFRGEGVGVPSGYGIAGGDWGKGGTMTLYPQGGEPYAAPKYGVRSFGPLRLTSSSPGGGGWGDPMTREPALVARDVRDGVVSPEAAVEVYGVVFEPDGVGIDLAATKTLRRDAETAFSD